MFQGEDRAAAVSVPFFYGIVEAVILLVYCTGAWKAGWTKAPSDVTFWHMLVTSYEVLESPGDIEDIEKPADEEDDYYMIDYKETENDKVYELAFPK